MKFEKRTYDLLVQVHHLKLDVFNVMTAFDPSDRDALLTLASIVTDLEFLQQRLSGFPEDRKFHLFWLVTHCCCPKEENERRWRLLKDDYPNYPGPAHEVTCPIHGLELAADQQIEALPATPMVC